MPILEPIVRHGITEFHTKFHDLLLYLEAASEPDPNHN